MKSTPSKPRVGPRIRLHISKETALELARVREARGGKSWEEFFKEMLQGWEAEPSAKAKSNGDSEALLFAIQALETRNDELADYLFRLVQLLRLAFGVKDQPTDQTSAKESPFSRFIQRRTQGARVE